MNCKKIIKGLFHCFVSVLKSDMANGMFGFAGTCIPYHAETEDAKIECPIERKHGDADTVTLSWKVSLV